MSAADFTEADLAAIVAGARRPEPLDHRDERGVTAAPLPAFDEPYRFRHADGRAA